jgi:3-phosphoshikimate 1-carboxyvinyltransferase
VHGTNGVCAPLDFEGGNKLYGIDFVLPVASAQLKSCMLLAGLFSEEGVKVYEKEISRDHTERMLGIKAEVSAMEGTIHYLQTSNRTNVPNMSGHIPADFSAAAFWLVAGAIHPDAEIIIPKVGMNRTRNAALKVLQRMGASIEIKDIPSKGEPLADLVVRSSSLNATTIEAE